MEIAWATSEGVFVVKDLFEPCILVFLVELSCSIEEVRQLVCHYASVSSADDRSVAKRVYLWRSREVAVRIELALVASILKHILVVLHIPWLEVLLERLSSIRRCLAISGWLLRLRERPFGQGIIYSWSLFKDLAVENILSFISLVQSSFSGLRVLPAILELPLLTRQISVLLDLLLCQPMIQSLVDDIFMPHVDRVHCLDLREGMTAQFKRLVIDLSFA